MKSLKEMIESEVKEKYDLHEHCDNGCIYNCTEGFRKTPNCITLKQ